MPFHTVLRYWNKLHDMPQQARRVTRVNARLRNIFRNHGSGSNNYAIADCNGQNGRVRPNADPVSNFRRLPEIGPAFCRAPGRKEIIYEHGAMRDEAVISNSYELTDKYVRLDATSFPDNDTTLDLDKWSDQAAFTDDATI
jgi:hypothetical protein